MVDEYNSAYKSILNVLNLDSYYKTEKKES